MKIRYIVILIAFIMIKLHAQPMYYTWNGTKLVPSAELNATWKETTINIKKIANSSLPSTVSHQQANTALSNSVIAWDFAGNLYTYTRDDEITSPGIAIGFTTNKNIFLHPDTAPAVTKHHVSENVYISSTTSIALNNTVKFAEDFNLTIFYPHAEQDEIHLPSVILHELGHAFGLSHNSNTSSAMHENIAVGQILTFNQDDKDGILALYEATVHGFGSTEGNITFTPTPGTYQLASGENYITFDLSTDVDLTDSETYLAYNKGTTDNPPLDIVEFVDRRVGFNDHPYLWPGERIIKAAVIQYTSDYSSYELLTDQFEVQYTIEVPTGVNDYIFFSPQISSFETNYTYIGGGEAYILNFIDAYPYGDYMDSWDNWKCYASYGSGEVLIMDSQSFNIPNLPGGYNWERDSYGNVIARMEIGGTDSDGDHHETSAEIKISSVPYPPNTPTGFSISGTTGQHPTLSWNLNTEPDIFKYNIYEDHGNGMQFLTSVNHPTNNYTYSGVTIGGRFDPQICFTVTAVSSSNLESDETLPQCINASSVSKRYISEKGSGIPTEYKLSDSYPNPFNPSTNIEFQLPQNANVIVKVYDIQGNEIEKLVNEYLSAGYYSVTFDGSNLSSGVYIYTIQMNDYHSVKKMLLLK